jgi:hypothetical protein
MLISYYIDDDYIVSIMSSIAVLPLCFFQLYILFQYHFYMEIYISTPHQTPLKKIARALREPL